ncbi:MAG TPA: hypothetical protein VHB01_08870 [Nitrosospira sp.]|jgi:hypothetical protein|nr:hypothetical protein [Nitrosospira sp.]
MKIPIPENHRFSLRELIQNSSTDGNMEFDWSLIEDICAASGMDMEEFLDTREHGAFALIHEWYAEHRGRGGAPDPVMEDILIATKIEEALGSSNRTNGDKKD